MIFQDTIIALATPSGIGAISVIRISGKDAIRHCASCFESPARKDLNLQKSHTLHLGYLKDGERIIDEVLVSLFKAPRSYTGENIVEISCHGSPYIQQEIIQLFLRKGCRMAEAGEFTLRAFLNGEIDLSQAEAFADLIASNSEASHKIALQQMRGGFSSDIKKLRAELLHFASLIELELDFAEEDVAFADRKEFENLLAKIKTAVQRLTASFATGNVIKNGIPIAIAGKPNVGKSTLLNALLHEERAIVSEIPGTTRDAIEEVITIGGIPFRFIDTAGIRDTQDVIESIGIQKTFEKIAQAQVVIYVFDCFEMADGRWQMADGREEEGKINNEDLGMVMERIKSEFPEKTLLIVGNKVDKLSAAESAKLQAELPDLLLIAARAHTGIAALQSKLLEFIDTGILKNNDTIVTNARHYKALLNVLGEIERIQQGLKNNLPGDLLAIDIRQALQYLGEITGEITTEDLLGNIFAHFCIGK